MGILKTLLVDSFVGPSVSLLEGVTDLLSQIRVRIWRQCSLIAHVNGRKRKLNGNVRDVKPFNAGLLTLAFYRGVLGRASPAEMFYGSTGHCIHGLFWPSSRLLAEKK